jgi:hypothetical protein
MGGIGQTVLLARRTPTIKRWSLHARSEERLALYLSAYGILLPRMKHWGLTARRFHGRSQTECQRGSSGLFTCKARTVARALEPVFRKAGHDRRLP